jgi:hypothetical protein
MTACQQAANAACLDLAEFLNEVQVRIAEKERRGCWRIRATGSPTGVLGLATQVDPDI